MSTLPKPHGWTREQYGRVGRLGGFEPDQRLELIDGEIVDRSPQSEPHAVALCLLDEALRRAYGGGYVIRIQSPLALDPGSTNAQRAEGGDALGETRAIAHYLTDRDPVNDHAGDRPGSQDGGSSP